MQAFSGQISHLCSHYSPNYGSPSLRRNQQSATSINGKAEKSSSQISWVSNMTTATVSPFYGPRMEEDREEACLCTVDLCMHVCGRETLAQRRTSWNKLGYNKAVVNSLLLCPRPEIWPSFSVSKLSD